MSTALVILGCGQRKKQTSRLLPAIDRYDGPLFQVLRKYTRESPESSPDAFILSARFGLIAGDSLVPRYDRPLVHRNHLALCPLVERQLKRTLEVLQPERLFVSVGSRYWPLLAEALAREVVATTLLVATGGIGGRASQLAHWLRLGEGVGAQRTTEHSCRKATLLGTTVELNRAEVLQEARNGVLAAPTTARRFETWYVAVGRERVAAKWLVSVLFDKPVARFRTAEARQALRQLGVETRYAEP